MRHPGILLTALVCVAMPCKVLQAAKGKMSSASLRAASRYSALHRGYSFLVMQDGDVIYESYANGDAPDRIASIFSATKGFWCVAAAAAVQDGILDFNEPVCHTIPEWCRDSKKSEIRVRDLLNFTAGIEPSFSLHGRSISDRNGYSVRVPAATQHGQYFMYGPSQLQIFCELLRRKLVSRHMTPKEYLSRRVLGPRGLAGVDFREDVHGNPLLASGFRLRV